MVRNYLLYIRILCAVHGVALTLAPRKEFLKGILIARTPRRPLHQ